MGVDVSKMNLSSVDSLFGIDTAKNENMIQMISISDLHEFPSHPFKVLDDEKMQETIESVKESGVLVPIIVRPDTIHGGYQILAGHRRTYASKQAGITEIPTLIRDVDDETATIIMVDSNLQRENLLFSEKAFAYKMKLEAMKRKAGRPQKNCSQVGNNFSGQKSIDDLAEEVGESKNQIYRYIRLTQLMQELLEMTDKKILAFNIAVELSYLRKEEQEIVFDIMEKQQIKPSLSDVVKLKNLSKEKELTEEMISIVLLKEKEEPITITIKGNSLKKYFPQEYTPKQMQEVILQLLENWQKGKKE